MSTSISFKDIIELGPESKYKGKKVLKLAQVVKIKRESVEAIDLSSPSSILIIPMNQLYDKQELTGKLLAPFEERELAALGAQNLWIKLTPKQYKEYKELYKTLEEPESRNIEDEKQIEFLKKLFASEKEEQPKEPVFKFPELDHDEKPKREIPLGKFISKRNYGK